MKQLQESKVDYTFIKVGQLQWRVLTLDTFFWSCFVPFSGQEEGKEVKNAWEPENINNLSEKAQFAMHLVLFTFCLHFLKLTPLWSYIIDITLI